MLRSSDSGGRGRASAQAPPALRAAYAKAAVGSGAWKSSHETWIPCAFEEAEEGDVGKFLAGILEPRHPWLAVGA
ncbi:MULTISPECIES: hypothetical protein [Streptomyces]|uniref:hypothetical protein n=1 Tax=Streptomyces TaxID=1883 RepID=UPI001ED9549B|nr:MULTISPECIES: hypothetical protein [Streptomyces]WTD23375.1 hypothetical protein OH737_02085 [Streptomyces anulatus]